MKTARTTGIAKAVLAAIALNSWIVAPTTPPAKAQEFVAPTTPPAESQAQEAPVSLSPTDRALMEYGKAQFAAAGLEYPEAIVVTFHDDSAECGGQDGRLRRVDGVDRIWICKTHENPKVREVWRKRTLIHELAHVWERRTLDDDDRAAFLELRGLDSWNDRSQEWWQRGTEHAAEILTWGLLDEPFQFVLIPDHDCDAFAKGYELLTGLEPHTGLECD